MTRKILPLIIEIYPQLKQSYWILKHSLHHLPQWAFRIYWSIRQRDDCFLLFSIEEGLLNSNKFTKNHPMKLMHSFTAIEKRLFGMMFLHTIKNCKAYQIKSPTITGIQPITRTTLTSRSLMNWRSKTPLMILLISCSRVWTDAIRGNEHPKKMVQWR